MRGTTIVIRKLDLILDHANTYHRHVDQEQCIFTPIQTSNLYRVMIKRRYCWAKVSAWYTVGSGTQRYEGIIGYISRSSSMKPYSFAKLSVGLKDLQHFRYVDKTQMGSMIYECNDHTPQ